MAKCCSSPTPGLLQQSNPCAPAVNVVPIPPPPLREETLPEWVLPQALFDFNFGDVRTLYWFATMARATYGPTDQYFLQAARAVVPANYPIVFSANSVSLTPGFGFIKTPRCGILVVSGTTSLAQALVQVLASFLVSTNFSAPPLVDKGATIPVWLSATNAIDAALAAYPANLPMIVVGHSYGAAVAAVLCYKWLFGSRSGSLRLLSFASPKPGNSSLAHEVNNRIISNRRFAIAGDVVPALPPSFGLGALVLPPAIAPMAAQWSQFRHTTYLNLLAANGTWQSSDEPSLIDAAAQSIVAAGLNQPLPLVANHRMKAFVQRLRAGFEGYPPTLESGWLNPSGIDAANAGMDSANL